MQLRFVEEFLPLYIAKSKSVRSSQANSSNALVSKDSVYVTMGYVNF